MDYYSQPYQQPGNFPPDTQYYPLPQHLQPYAVYYNEPPPNYLELGILIGVVLIIVLYLIYSWWNGLSDDELGDCSDIMQNFHNDPNQKDFLKIWELRHKLLRQTGRPVKFWIYGVHESHPELLDVPKKSEIGLWAREIVRGINTAKTHPTPELLDCVWSLYFASGDVKYSEIIRDACVYRVPVVREAAKFSYNTIMGEEWDPFPNGVAEQTRENV